MIEFTGARFFERRLIRRVESAVYAVLGQRDIFTVDLAVTDGEEQIALLIDAQTGEILARRAT